MPIATLPKSIPNNQCCNPFSAIWETIEALREEIANIERETITVDSAFNQYSTNPVQNRVITFKVNEIDDRMDVIENKLIKITTYTR